MSNGEDRKVMLLTQVKLRAEGGGAMRALNWDLLLGSFLIVVWLLVAPAAAQIVDVPVSFDLSAFWCPFGGQATFTGNVKIDPAVFNPDNGDIPFTFRGTIQLSDPTNNLQDCQFSNADSSEFGGFVPGFFLTGTIFLQSVNGVLHQDGSFDADCSNDVDFCTNVRGAIGGLKPVQCFFSKNFGTESPFPFGSCHNLLGF